VVYWIHCIGYTVSSLVYEVVQPSAQVLSSKLSGLELGRGRSGDSGVVSAPSHKYRNKLYFLAQVSPSEASTEGERERLVSESNSKTRSHSGEDAGIGSEQGGLTANTVKIRSKSETEAICTNPEIGRSSA
jgi:hypothetical protein